MRKTKNIISFFISIFAVIFMLSYAQTAQTTIATSSNPSLSNQLIAWGVKREKDHKQPDLGSQYKKLVEQYGGITMGGENSKKVYLTFDLGYEAGYTDSILDTLKENNVTATFFITAHYLNTQEELVKKMIKGQNFIGNHTVNHYSIPSLSDEKLKEEIMLLHTALYEKTGYEMKYFRPPKGEFSERTLDIVKNLGYTNVMWSFAYDDWDENKQGRESYGKQKILDNIHNGAVLLLHATSKDNMNILGDCIKEIKEMGYEFASLDEFEK